MQDDAEHWIGNNMSCHLSGRYFVTRSKSCNHSGFYFHLYNEREGLGDFSVLVLTSKCHESNFAFCHVLELYNLIPVEGSILLASPWSTLWINLRNLKNPEQPPCHAKGFWSEPLSSVGWHGLLDQISPN